jgi:hypothetical protein
MAKQQRKKLPLFVFFYFHSGLNFKPHSHQMVCERRPNSIGRAIKLSRSQRHTPSVDQNPAGLISKEKMYLKKT